MENHTDLADEQQQHRLNVEMPKPATYSIDVRRSTVKFTVRHLFGVGLVRGQFGLRSGEVVVAGSGGELTVCAVLAAVSFETGNPSRDATVRGKRMLDTGRFPDLKFLGSSLEWSPSGVQLGGQLRVRDTDSPLSLTVVECQVSEQTLHVGATAEVDRVVAGVRGLRGLAGRRLHVRLDVWASPVLPDGQVT